MVSCNGGSDGSVTVTGSGGTVAGDYTYLWSNGQTTATATGLAAGSYTVTITDDNGCQASAGPVTITEPDVLSIGSMSMDSVSCNGLSDGTATANGITGGNGTNSFSWTGGSTTNPATGLSAGNYTVTVTDQKGCSTTGSIDVLEPDALVANLLDTDSVICNGESDGAATVDASGGTAGYDVSWTGVTVSGTTYSDNPVGIEIINDGDSYTCLLYTSPSPRD